MKSGLLLISLQGFHVLRLFVYSGGQVVPESIKHRDNDQSIFLLIPNVRKGDTPRQGNNLK